MSRQKPPRRFYQLSDRLPPRNPVPPPPAPRWWIRHAAPIGSWSNAGLLLLAGIGYFLTVVPIQQKERLAEQNAEMEGKLKERKAQIEALDAKAVSLEAHVAELSQEVVDTRKRAHAETAEIKKEAEAERERISRMMLAARKRADAAIAELAAKVARREQEEFDAAMRDSEMNGTRLANDIFARQARFEGIRSRLTNDCSRSEAILEPDPANALKCLLSSAKNARGWSYLLEEERSNILTWLNAAETYLKYSWSQTKADEYTPIAQMLMQEAFRDAIPCRDSRFKSGSGMIVEIRRANAQFGTGCVQAETMAQAIGGLVARQTSVQIVRERAVSGAEMRILPYVAPDGSAAPAFAHPQSLD